MSFIKFTTIVGNDKLPTLINVENIATAVMHPSDGTLHLTLRQSMDADQISHVLVGVEAKEAWEKLENFT